MTETKKRKSTSDKSNADTPKPFWTDKTQAIMSIIGTLAAIVGILLAWISLTKNDKELQGQIENLEIVANESVKQTKILMEQYSVLNDELDFQKQQSELKNSQRQSEIEPKLIIELEDYNGDIVSGKLINIGKPAKIIKIEENIPNDFVINIPLQYVSEDKVYSITFKYKNAESRNENTALNFTITYEDIDKKQYSKPFKFTNIEKIINDKYQNENLGQ